MVIVEGGSAAYSSLVEIEMEKKIAVLHERDSYGYITFEAYSVA